VTLEPHWGDFWRRGIIVASPTDCVGGSWDECKVCGAGVVARDVSRCTQSDA